MQEYRAYILGSDGHIMQRIDLLCVDDDDAKVQAKKLVDGHDVELWQSVRLVTTFKHIG